MARPAKVKVDYFPHVTHTGKTIAILEARWVNDGYAFWFKLLELLGDSNDFSYNCNSSADWEYLLSKARVTESVATAILDKLAEIEAIDATLWAEKIVWSDHFVSNLEPVFDRRKCEAPQKPGLCMQKPLPNDLCPSLCANNSAKTVHIPTETDKVKETKEKETKAEEREGEKRNARAGAQDLATADDPAQIAEPKRKSRKKPEASCPSMLRDGVERQADTVFLKPDERERLRTEYGNEGAERIIALLDAYKTNHPGKCGEYRDDYKVITSWVISRYLEERASPQPQAGRPQTFIDKLAEMARKDAGS